MFERDEKADEAIGLILGVLRRHERGQVVPHEEIEAACGLTRRRDGGKYYRRVESARRALRDADGVWSSPETGVGFRLLTKQDTLVGEQVNRMRRAGRQIGKGRVAAHRLPNASLTHHERRLKDAAVQRADAMRRELLHLRKRSSEVDKPYQGPPRREWVHTQSTLGTEARP